MDVFDRIGSVQDEDTMELLEIEKVRITADDEMGVGREGTGKNGVVVRVGMHDVPDAGGLSPLGEP